MMNTTLPCPRPASRWRRLTIALALLATTACAWASDARTAAVFGPGRPAADGGYTMDQDRLLRMPGTRRERARLPAGTTLRLAQQRQVLQGGQRHDLLLWEGRRSDGEGDGGFGDEVAVLAVFPAGQNAPTDVAEVKTDRFTFLRDGPPMKLTHDDEAFELLNTHHNAGQPYTSASLFHLRGGRLRRIAVVDLLGELSGCAKAFDQTLQWRTEPDMAPLPVIVASVTLVQAPRGHTGPDHGCEGRRPAEKREVFEDRWRWNPARDQYVHQGGTLSRLDRWNDGRR